MKRSPFYLVVPCLAGITLVLALLALLSGPQTAYAAPDFDLTDNCSAGVGDVAALWTAMNDANQLGSSQVITLAAGCVYTFPAANNYWYGPNALPAITGTMAIEGNGARFVITDAVRLRFFYVAGYPTTWIQTGTLTLRNLTLSGGRQKGGDTNYGGGGAGMGGAIFNQGRLTLDSVTLSGNVAVGGNGKDGSSNTGGGGMGNNPSPVDYGGSFGAGWMVPAGAPVGGVSDRAGGGGAGFDASGGNNVGDTGGVGGGPISDTVGGDGGFGAVGSGGAGNDGGGGGGGGGAGGGGNGGSFGKGGTGMGMTGGGGGGIGGGGGGGGTGGGGGGFGGGGGGGGTGGGAGGFGGGGGSGSGFFGGASSGFGGGNGANSGGGGGGGAGLGGAVFNHYGTLTVTNSTFSGNSASGGNGYSGGFSLGAAVFNLDGRVLIQNSTWVSNSLQYGTANGGSNGLAAGGALYSRKQDGAPSVTLSNTILANTTFSSTNDFSMTAQSGSHAVVLGGYNLVENDGGQLSGIVVSTADPQVGPLQNNGGVGMWTHALFPGSPAINAGDPGFAALPNYDQRGAGYPRVAGGRVDIGAYEAPVCFATIDGSTVYSSTDSSAVRQALGAANSGDVVKLAGYCAGTVAQSGSMQVALITKTVTLAGGYTNSNWLVSYPLTQPTTLDAQGGGRVLSITVAATLQGFTVTRGYINAGGSDANGGGIYAAGVLTLSAIGVYSNAITGSGGSQTGGGVYISGLAVMTSTNFISNTARGGGGGAYVGGAATVSGGTFERNVAPDITNGYGGGLAANNALTLTGTTFYSNTAGYRGGGAYVRLAATLTNATFISNTARTNQGGGAFVYMGAALVNGGMFERNAAPDTSFGAGGGLHAETSLVLTGTAFYSNTVGDRGGGLAVAWLTTTLTNAVFIGNTARTYRGGGAYLSGAALVSGGTFERNAAPNATNGSGGGLYANKTLTLTGTTFYSNAAGYLGGGVCVSNTAVLTNVVFISNTAQLDRGGGAYLGGAATVNGGKFERNIAGSNAGGLYANNTLALTGTTFYSNTAGVWGGGVYGASTAALTHAVFISNTAPFGGGAAVEYGLELADSVFRGNMAAGTSGTGGGVFSVRSARVLRGEFVGNSAYVGGGGMAVYEFGTLILTDTQFLSNTVVGTGGGGGIYCGDAVTATGGLFQGNIAESGGGLFIYTSLLMQNTRLISNTARSGGAITYQPNNSLGTLKVVNSLLANNLAMTGSAVAVTKPAREVSLLHNTVVGSVFNSGSAIYVTTGTVGITNTIITSYTTGIDRVGGVVNEDYNLFFGNTRTLSGTITSGGHSLTGTPAFVNPAANDYHLAVGSQAIDKGTNAGVNVDFDGYVRPWGNGYDMGAYEAPPVPVLYLAKSVLPVSAVPGAIVTYTLVFSNVGNLTATTTLLTDTIPMSISVTGVISSGVAITDTKYTPAYMWQVANLAPGVTGYITVTGVLSATLPDGMITNTAVITAGNALTVARATVGIAVQNPPVLQTFFPSHNTVDVTPNTIITANYNLPMAAATVMSRTFVVHGMQSGLVTATHGLLNNTTLAVTPTRTFHAGEQVYVVATTRTTSITGTHPVSGTQWAFTAGNVYSRTFGAFTDISAGLTAVNQGSVTWGDYDNDGDLDILLVGFGGTSNWWVAKVYRNDNGVFTDIGAGLTGVVNGEAAWGDYDNDGDLDILLVGQSSANRVAKVYRNDKGVFIDIGAGLTGVSLGEVAWGDYDNDGDLDILLTGGNGSVWVAKVYRNDNGVFIDIGAGLIGVVTGEAAWGDYDNDGDLDILLTGEDNGGTWVSKVYRNDAGVFTDIGAGLIGVANGESAWGDYDNDGDLDILLTGTSSSSLVAKVYRNDNGVFTDIGAGLTAVYYSSAAWGDYDNDGDLDILLTGVRSSGVSKVYRNDNGVFTDIDAGLTGVYYSSAAWGDYDNDGDLDILLAGLIDSSNRMSKVYRNDDAQPVLRLTKVVTPVNVLPGATITYSLVFSNAGNLPTMATLITDTIPGSVSVTSVISSGVTITDTGYSPAYMWQIADLAPGATGYITVTGVLNASLPPGTFTNTATLTATNAPAEATAEAGLTVVLPVCFATINATTVYSSADASAVRDALAAAGPGSTVKVAGYCAGAVAQNGSTQVALITQTLTLAGGYSTTNWLVSYPLTQPTTLDALGGGRVLSITVAATLQGFTVTNGYIANNGGGIYAAGALTLTNINVVSNTTTMAGGGAYLSGAATVSGGVFERNAALNPTNGWGGGLYANNTLALTGTAFYSNTAGRWGGGAWAESNAALTNTVFISNTAVASGGGAQFVTTTIIVSSTFQNNLANYSGGVSALGDIMVRDSAFLYNRAVIWNGGGANFSASVTMISTTFQGNTAAQNSGGAYFGGITSMTGTTFLNNTAVSGVGGGARFGGTVNITNTAFISNTAVNGGGLYVAGALTLRDTEFLTNTAFIGGGASANNGATLSGGLFQGNTSNGGGGGAGGLYANGMLVVTGTQFIGNIAPNADNGGGLYHAGSGVGQLVNALFAGNAAAGNGGAMYFSSSGAVVLLHTTIASPTVGAGDAIYVITGTVDITNTIVSSYTTGIQVGGTGAVNSDYNLFYNAPTSVIIGSHSLTATDPLFVDPAGVDYHLAAGSPAGGAGINAGVVTDRDGTLRADPPTMGAYEAPPDLWLVKTVTPTSAAPGATITYTLAFSSVDATATGILLTDTIPVSVSVNSVISSGVAVTDTGYAPVYAWQIGGLASGATGYITVTGVMSNALPVGTFITNTAILTAANAPTAVTATVVITVVDAPITGLSAASSSPTTLGQATYFTATISGGSNVAYQWNFGDGNIGVGANVTHTYALTGTYTAIVTATNSISTAAVSTVVTITDVPITGLSAASSSPTTLGQATYFTATIGDGSNVAYQWNFGDGNIGVGTNVTHTYALTGTYTAIVTATNSISTVAASTLVTITDVPITGLSAASSSPTTLGQTTYFTATIGGGSNVAYQWNFGDGTALGSGANVTHTYTLTGTYTTIVTATNSISVATASTLATVTNLPPVADAGPDQNVTVNTLVTLNGSASYDLDGHTPLVYGWMQTEGLLVTLSNAASVAPTFTAPITPTVLTFSLVVTDTYGLSDATPDTVVITVTAPVVSGAKVYLPLVQR